MKTSSIFSALLISSALLTSACTPQDKAVVDKNLRADIQAQNNRKAGKGGGGSPINGTQFSLNNYGLSAFLLEKQIEAVELVKLVTGSLDAKSTQYSLAKLEDKEGLNQAQISFAPEGVTYVNDDGTWKTKTTKATLAAEYGRDANGNWGVKISGANIKNSVDSTEKKGFFVNHTDKTYELSLTPSKKEGVYDLVVLVAEGVLGGGKGQGNKNIDIKKVELTLEIDKDSLETSDVKIISAKAGMKYPGTNNRDFNSGLEEATDLIFKISGLCSQAVGTIKGTAGPKNYKVELGEEKIKIGPAERKLAVCGKRPTVDLSRLLNF